MAETIHAAKKRFSNMFMLLPIAANLELSIVLMDIYYMNCTALRQKPFYRNILPAKALE